MMRTLLTTFVASTLVAVVLNAQMVPMSSPTNSIQLRNGSNYTSLKAASTGGGLTLILPSSAGNLNDVLTTDGFGNLSWVAGGGGITSLDGLSDAKSEGAFFTGSLLIGHQSITPGMGGDDCQNNTAVGLGGVLTTLQTGDNNTAIGNAALSSVTSGSGNTGIGYSALSGVTLGATNIGIGQQAGSGITTGTDNIAIGYGALYYTTTGSNNVGVGRFTMNQGPTGSNNSAFGSNALLYAAAGSNNVAVGFEAG